jgi:hypothetical protein
MYVYKVVYFPFNTFNIAKVMIEPHNLAQCSLIFVALFIVYVVLYLI